MWSGRSLCRNQGCCLMPRSVMRWPGSTTNIRRSRSTHSSDSRMRLGMRYFAAQIRCTQRQDALRHVYVHAMLREGIPGDQALAWNVRMSLFGYCGSSKGYWPTCAQARLLACLARRGLRTDTAASPHNRKTRTSMMYRVTPLDQTSARRPSYCLWLSTSGATYLAEPTSDFGMECRTADCECTHADEPACST